MKGNKQRMISHQFSQLQVREANNEIKKKEKREKREEAQKDGREERWLGRVCGTVSRIRIP
jgi:hypothetical protein